jgi:hypothetical protein
METKEEDEQFYLTSSYTLIKIKKSGNKLFKYIAIIGGTDGLINIPFGRCQRDGTPFYHYCDRTGLGLYKDFDNYNPIKSRAWYTKHKDKINKLFYNSTGLEHVFLQS